jgi:hypothetical protein
LLTITSNPSAFSEVYKYCCCCCCYRYHYEPLSLLHSLWHC